MEKTYCSYCSSKIFDEDRTCPKCGAPTSNVLIFAEPDYSVVDNYFSKGSIMERLPDNWYIGLILDSLYNEPSRESGYKRVYVNKKMFSNGYDNKSIVNKTPFAFDESLAPWGNIIGVAFYYKENGGSPFAADGIHAKNVKANTTVYFSVGSFTVNG